MTYDSVRGAAPHLDNFGSVVGYGAAASAQFLVGGFLVGLGLGVLENRPMIYTIHCSDILGRRIKHNVDLGDRASPLFPADLRGVDLTNANLRGTDLQSANLEGAILTGADLRDANLRGANLGNANLTYSNLWGADLRDTNCDGTKFYPCQMPKHAGKLWGAKITETTDLDMPPPAEFRWW